MESNITGDIADILLREGLITQKQLEQAKHEHHVTHKSLGRILVDKGLISEKVRLGILQKKLDCEIYALGDMELDLSLVKRLPRSLAMQHRAVPVGMDQGEVVIAMDDPSDLEAVDKLTAVIGSKTHVVLVKSSELTRLLDQYPQDTVKPSRPPLVVRFLSILMFWIMILIPVVTFYLALQDERFQVWLGRRNLTAFDYALYFVLLNGFWGVLTYYFHDLVFGRFFSSGAPPPEKN